MSLHKSKRLERAKRAAERLSEGELRALDGWIHELLAALDAAKEQPIPVRPGAVVIEERRVGHKTYRLQRVKCGKNGCKCATGPGHGPYWYAYWWGGGRTRSKYIGRTDPPP